MHQPQVSHGAGRIYITDKTLFLLVKPRLYITQSIIIECSNCARDCGSRARLLIVSVIGFDGNVYKQANGKETEQ